MHTSSYVSSVNLSVHRTSVFDLRVLWWERGTLNSQVFLSCKYSCVAASLCRKAVDERKIMSFKKIPSFLSRKRLTTHEPVMSGQRWAKEGEHGKISLTNPFRYSRSCYTLWLTSNVNTFEQVSVRKKGIVDHVRHFKEAEMFLLRRLSEIFLIFKRLERSKKNLLCEPRLLFRLLSSPSFFPRSRFLLSPNYQKPGTGYSKVASHNIFKEFKKSKRVLNSIISPISEKINRKLQLGKDENQQQTQPTYDKVWDSNLGATLVGGKCCYHGTIPALLTCCLPPSALNTNLGCVVFWSCYKHGLVLVHLYIVNLFSVLVNCQQFVSSLEGKNKQNEINISTVSCTCMAEWFRVLFMKSVGSGFNLSTMLQHEASWLYQVQILDHAL